MKTQAQVEDMRGAVATIVEHGIRFQMDPVAVLQYGTILEALNWMLDEPKTQIIDNIPKFLFEHGFVPAHTVEGSKEKQ